jgi:hypothetical protein
MSLEAELEERERKRKETEEELRIVEEERQRLLEEYATKVQGFNVTYLPKGLFKSDAEYEAVTGKKVQRDELQSATAQIPTVFASSGPRSWIR